MELDIEALARYPTESDDWLVTVGIGGVATILSVLIIPAFLVAGYLLRAIRAGMDDAEEPPVFDEWGDLLTEGLVATIITIVYQIVPTIVFGVFVAGSALALLTGGDAATGAGLAGLFVGFLVWWVLAILFGYVGLAGVANYAREGRFGAGFDVDVILDVVTSMDYLVAWLYVIVLQVVVGVVVGVLNVVPVLGGLVGVFVSFYALIIAAWLWGRGFAEALDLPAAGETDQEIEGEGTPAP